MGDFDKFKKCDFSGLFPAHLHNIPGKVGDIVKWMNETAMFSQPILNIGNALALYGAVIGRKVSYEGLRSNMYIVGLGESGSGKDHSRKCSQKLLVSAGIFSDLYGGEEFTSDAAIETAVFKRNSCLYQIDEIGHIIRQSTDIKAPSHARSIMKTLTKMFTSASSMYRCKSYASERTNPEREIDQPNLCIYGTTVPHTLFEAITPSQIKDGFLGRNLMVVSEDPTPIKRQYIETLPPQDLLDDLKNWSLRQKVEYDPLATSIESISINQTINVKATIGAVKLFDDFFNYRISRMNQLRDVRCLDALWARSNEHAKKIALILACGENYFDPEISTADAQWAIDFVTYSIDVTIHMVSESVSDSDFEHDLLAVKKVILDAGEGGIGKPKLCRQTRKLKPNDRDQILRALIESEDIRGQEIHLKDNRSLYKYFIS